MTVAVETHSLGRRFGVGWALRDCTLALPQGCLAAVVGPNGAGKTTLLNMLVGLLPASEGELTVFGRRPENTTAFLGRVGFVGQDAPLYRQFSAADLLRLGRHLNPGWDDALARERLRAAGVALDRPAAKLSGGQRAQLALALAVGKRPDLLVLDEPLASLDPLARREFLQSLMATASEGTTVILSSHLISDLERVCDFLVIIAGGTLRLAGRLEDVIGQHHWVAGAPEHTSRLPANVRVVAASHQSRHSRLLVRSPDPLLNPALITTPVDLEDLVLSYLQTDSHPMDRTPELRVQS